MKKEEWLRGEIAKWRSDGAVDAPTAEALLARYPAKESRFSWGAVFAGSFGALLVGLGLIAIFAANWDFMGRGARAAVSVAPLVACGAAAVLGKAKGWRSPAFWEPIGILWFVATVAATCLVAQTYNMGGAVPDLVMFVAVLTLPVVWVTGSTAAMCAWPFVAIVYMLEKMDIGAVVGESLLMLAASVPAYVAFVRRRPPRAAFLLGQLATGLVYSAGTALIVVCGAHCSIETGVMVFWGCSAIVLAVGVVRGLPVWPKVALAVASLAAMPTVSPHGSDAGGYGMFLLYMMSLVLASATAVYGIERRKLSYTNIGASLLLYLILAKFFMSDVEFTVKGIVMIVSGAALAALNVVLVRARKEAGK